MRTLIDSITVEDIQLIIQLFNALISMQGPLIFSMSRNRTHRLYTLILAFTYFEGANIYFSIFWLKSLHLKEELWWFSISLVFIAAYILCAVHSSIFHLVLILHTFNETKPRLPNIKFKTLTQVMLIVLLCLCGVLGLDDAMFLSFTIPIFLPLFAGVQAWAIHREESWLADKLCRVLYYLVERPFIFINMMSASALIQLSNHNSLKSTDNATISNTYNLEDVHVPTDVLYIRKIDERVIFRAYVILSFQEGFLGSVYEKLHNELPRRPS